MKSSFSWLLGAGTTAASKFGFTLRNCPPDAQQVGHAIIACQQSYSAQQEHADFMAKV